MLPATRKAAGANSRTMKLLPGIKHHWKNVEAESGQNESKSTG
jgi:hypothetical protein